MHSRSVAAGVSRVSRALVCPWGSAALVIVVALMQCYSLHEFSGQRVDESEVVAYAVGFFGGDLNPHWFGYGSFPIYLLSFIYLVAWLIGHLAGVFGSLEHYAQMLITNEYYFYGIARYLFACVGVTTVVFYARTLRRVGVPILLVAGYFAIAVTHPFAIEYANYIKVDHFVSLLFAIAAYCIIVAPSAKGTLYVLAVTCALALNSKISAVSILALFAVAGGAFYIRERKWQPLILAAVLFALVVVITQPYLNPVVVAVNSLERHESGVTFSILRPAYGTVIARLVAIASYMTDYLSVMHGVAFALLPFIFVREARRITVRLLLVLLLVISPFLVASQIQPYWMIPVYPLLCLFPVLGAFGLYALIKRWSVPWSRGVIGTATLLVAVLVVFNCEPILSHWRTPVPPSNQLLLKHWLESNVLGTDVVVLERSHSNLMPRVHDLSSLARSREASRLFIFNRRENEFLGAIFDNYLIKDYPRSVAAMTKLTARKVKSMKTRLDLTATGPQHIELPSICDGYGHCRHMSLEAVRGGSVKAIRGSFVLTPSRTRQSLVFASKGNLLLDGSHFLELVVQGESRVPGRVSVGAGGAFYPGDRLIIPASGHLRVPLFQFGKWPWLVNFRSVKDLARIPHSSNRRLLFVTSPAIYNRYMVLDPTQFKGRNRVRIVARQDFYRRLLASPVVHRIGRGEGPAMEVYDITNLGSNETKGVSHANRRPAGKLIWLVPAALNTCKEHRKVLVHWNASRVKGVKTVEVKTVRGAGKEGMFARSGPIGTKLTGPWMRAGRQLLLRNAENGKELGSVTLGALPCGSAVPDR